MKKVLCLACCVLLLICSSCSKEAAPIYTEEELNNFKEKIESAMSLDVSADLSIEDEYILIKMSYADITNFGALIYDVRNACENTLEDKLWSLNLLCYISNSSGKVTYSANSDEANYGILYDTRGADPKQTELENVDDLITEFPATRQFINRLQIPEEDLIIYDTVMEALYSDFDRPEAEIFEELSSEFGMSAEELKIFVNNIMDELNKK